MRTDGEGGGRLSRGAGGQWEIDLACSRPHTPGRPSARTAALSVLFGLPMAAVSEAILSSVRVAIGPGRIVLLTGPSGAGKTTALAQIQRRCAGGCSVERVTFPAEAAIIDHIAPWAPLEDALSYLTACGLGDARLWLRRFEELSEGERFRARLARAVARHDGNNATAPLLCDEFCSTLHARAAKAICHSLRNLVSRRKLSLVVASSREDLVSDLQPDTIVRLHEHDRCDVVHSTARVGKPLTLRRKLCLARGKKRDYDAFAGMHYRATDELGFVDKVFVLREGYAGEAVGIVVYSHAPLELALRNRATGGYFSGRPDRVNGQLRILRRLVIHPDLRGCGLGHYLVRKTLPLVGTEFVECLASMGAMNPVFERAGMTRVGQCELPRSGREALQRLKEMDIDPFASDFPVQVARQRRVRSIVAAVVARWYAATTGGGERRVARQSPLVMAQTFRGLVGTRPVYYLWRSHAKRPAIAA